MQESKTYKRIDDILYYSCDLTAKECYILRGHLAAIAQHLLNKEQSNSQHKPNITMNAASSLEKS